MALAAWFLSPPPVIQNNPPTRQEVLCIKDRLHSIKDFAKKLPWTPIGEPVAYTPKEARDIRSLVISLGVSKKLPQHFDWHDYDTPQGVYIRRMLLAIVWEQEVNMGHPPPFELKQLFPKRQCLQWGSLFMCLPTLGSPRAYPNSFQLQSAAGRHQDYAREAQAG